MMFQGTVNGSKVQFLMDSGATFCFWDLQQARDLGVQIFPTELTVEVADGHTVLCHHKCELAVKIEGYRENVWVYLLDLGDQSDVILGDDWLIHTTASLNYGSAPGCTVRKGNNTFKFVPKRHIVHPQPKNRFMTAVQAKRHIAQGGQYYAVRVVDDGVTPIHQPEEDVPSAAWMEQMPPCSEEMKGILEEYQDVFQPVHKCPPVRDPHMEHVIPLEPGTKAHWRPMKLYSPAELEAIEKMVQELLGNGLIEPSVSPWGSMLLFVKKPSGELRPCVDYRQLNKATVKDRFPLPRVEQIFAQLSGAQYFSGLDLQGGQK